MSDPEISDALLQNSMLEYDLTDVTTGKSTAKIAEFPYKGADDGSGYVYYTYLWEIRRRFLLHWRTRPVGGGGH